MEGNQKGEQSGTSEQKRPKASQKEFPRMCLQKPSVLQRPFGLTLKDCTAANMKVIVYIL